MRKTISVFLAVLLVLGLSVPVQAAIGYAVSLTPSRQTAAVGTTAYVRVSISGPMAYSTGDFTFRYDDQLLTFDEASSSIPQSYVLEDQEGKLRIKFIGAEKSLNEIFRLAFTVEAEGEASVRLMSARVDSMNNAVKDAPKANITNSLALITGVKQEFSVTLPDWFSGESFAREADDYDFTALDTHYDYTFEGSTMNGEQVQVDTDGTGAFQIQNVTGDIVIVSQRIPKNYKVSITGSAREDIQGPTGTEAAAYLTDYTFTVSNDPEYSYDPPEVYIGSSKFTGYTVSGGSYTIPGLSVTGDIIIRVNRTILDPKEAVSVAFSGTAAGDLQGQYQVGLNQNYSFRLNRQEVYEYTLSATMGGKNVNVVKQADGSYMILNVTGPLVITADKTALVTVAVDEYVKLDNGRSVYLITVTGPADNGQSYSYDGNVMFRSDAYGGWAWLVISDEALSGFSQEVPEKVGLTSANPVRITYNGDIDGNGWTDITDAQYVWDLYNASNDDFSQFSMEKFLRADLNGSHNVNMEDVVAVVQLA